MESLWFSFLKWKEDELENTNIFAVKWKEISHNVHGGHWESPELKWN